MKCRRITYIGILGLLPVCLAVAGCSEMPHAFQAIELGKPLDRSVIPRSATASETTVNVVETSGEKHEDRYLEVFEIHRTCLPAGLRWYEIRIYRDRQNNVIRVQYEESSGSYWFLLLASSNMRRERIISEAGKPQERLLVNEPLQIIFPLPEFSRFMMGVAMCFSRT